MSLWWLCYRRLDAKLFRGTRFLRRGWAHKPAGTNPEPVQFRPGVPGVPGESVISASIRVESDPYVSPIVIFVPSWATTSMTQAG
jgi:hypothetical protein